MSDVKKEFGSHVKVLRKAPGEIDQLTARMEPALMDLDAGEIHRFG